MADLTPAREDEILTELLERFDYADREWSDIRDEGTTDMRYVGGDVWDDKDRAVREKAGRPVLSLDELGQYVNQLINEVRQHKRAIQVTPIGNGAKDAIAKVRANLLRQIEYRSNKDIAYTTMFENTVQRSYGFLRVKARYEHPRSPHQELVIEPFSNPDMVTIDPDALSPDGSDMKFAFVHEWWSIKEFKRRWPKATVKSFDPEYRLTAPRWFTEDQRVRVAEYWTIEPKDRELLHLQTPEQVVAVFADELEPPADDERPLVKKKWLQKFGKLSVAFANGQVQILSQRTVEYPYVCQYLTNGIELLPPDPEKPNELKTKWPGTSIPLVACYGKVLWVDEGSGSKRKILSLVRLARDPAMLYCYYRTAQAEQVGMSTKNPYLAYRGQLNDVEKNEIAKSLHEPVAVLEYGALTEATGANILPPMQRNVFEPAIQALEIGAEGARRAVQAAMGISPLPTAAQRRTEKSGVALKEMRSAEQQGSFHFIDHYEMAITRTGAILNELLDDYYDAARDITVRTPADDTKQVRINDPQAPDEETGEPLMLTEGAYDVTLSTGPSQDSEREAANDFADNLVNNIPTIAPIIGQQPAAKLLGLSIRLKNLGPLGDEMTELIDPSSQKPDDPDKLKEQLQQAMQMVEGLTKVVQEQKLAIDTDQIKAERDVKLAEIKANADAQIKAAQLAAEVEMKREEFRFKYRELEVKQQTEFAKIGNAQMMARAEQEQELLHQHGEAAMQTQELDAKSMEGEMDRQAEREEGEASRQFESEEAERGRMAEERMAQMQTEKSSAEG